MTKKELTLIVVKVVKKETDQLKEDIINIMSVLLEQIETNKELIESMNSRPAQSSNKFRDKLMGNDKLNEVNNNHPFNKNKKSNLSNPLEDVLKQTHEEGEWRNMPD